MFELQSWKPVLTALVLPPTPFLLLALWGAWIWSRQRVIGALLVFVSALGLWAGASEGPGQALASMLHIPMPLRMDDVADLKKQTQAAGAPQTAIVVLGGGRERRAPEFGMADLTRDSLARLRYGVWLSRETGLPVAYSGGVGWAGDADGPSEAEIAARVAERDFLRPLKWTEAQSRDTRENAGRTVPMLRAAGIRQIVLVTQAYHMPRSKRAFEEAVAATGGGIRILPAPMGYFVQAERPVLRWLPSSEGFRQNRLMLHELLGLAVGS